MGLQINNKPNAGDEELKDKDIQPSVKEEIEADLDMEFIDERKISISTIQNYSLYRKANFKVLGVSNSVIGSSIRSSRTLSSNKEEVEAYFPNIIGISPNNADFVNRVKQYLNNIQVTVNESISLDISFIYNHKKDYLVFKAKEEAINEKFDKIDKGNIEILKKGIEDKIVALNALESTKHKYGRPRDIEQYIIYRHCLLYKDVAKDLSLINSDPTIRFYIKDEQKEKEKQNKLLSERNAAKRNYIEMIVDDKKFNAMLIQYCINNNISINDIILKDRVEKEMLLDTFSNDYPKKFNELYNDRNLSVKSFIETLIARGELIRSEFNQNISTANGDFIGANLKEAVAYFNNPNNEEVVKAYNNKLKFI